MTFHCQVFIEYVSWAFALKKRERENCRGRGDQRERTVEDVEIRERERTVEDMETRERDL